MPTAPTRVHYSHIETGHVGEVWFAESDRGLWRITFGSSRARFLSELAGDGIEAIPDQKRTAATRRALVDYFTGKTRTFDRKLDWSRLRGFDRKALRVCARIPYGKTLSYGEIARRAGSPGGARAAGQAMGKNPFPIIVPCHRVVKSDGTIGGFGGGLHHKRALLELEDIELPGEQPSARALSRRTR